MRSDETHSYKDAGDRFFPAKQILNFVHCGRRACSVRALARSASLRIRRPRKRHAMVRQHNSIGSQK